MCQDVRNVWCVCHLYQLDILFNVYSVSMSCFLCVYMSFTHNRGRQMKSLTRDQHFYELNTRVGLTLWCFDENLAVVLFFGIFALLP